jgi:hypothetical protein
MKTERTAAFQWKSAVVVVLAVLMATGCGGSSKVASSASSPTPSPVQLANPTPSSAPLPAQTTYTVNLTFSGGLSGRVTQTKVVDSSDCGIGKIDVEVIVHGQAWSLGASADSYHGSGRYKVPQFNLMLSSPTSDIWMSTSGTASYSTDTSLSVNVAITNLMAGPGEPGSTAHISGSIKCA